MSKERKFHKLIEQQNREEKNRVWAKIQQKEAGEVADRMQTECMKRPLKPFSWRKWATVAASSLAAAAIGVFALVKFFPFDGGVTTGNDVADGGVTTGSDVASGGVTIGSNVVEGGEAEENDNQYFTNQSYEAVKTEITLKEYAQEIGKDLLYFDWYAETEHVENSVWQLKDTQETICFREEILDMETGCIIDFIITDANTTIESLISYENTDRKTEIREVEINWRIKDDKAVANFVYEEYKYYLRVDEPVGENYILTLIEELLS